MAFSWGNITQKFQGWESQPVLYFFIFKCFNDQETEAEGDSLTRPGKGWISGMNNIWAQLASRPASAISPTSPPTQSDFWLQSYCNALELQVFHLQGHGLPGYRGLLTPVHGSTWRGPAVPLSMTRADPAVSPQTCLLPPECGSSWFPARTGKLGWNPEPWVPRANHTLISWGQKWAQSPTCWGDHLAQFAWS